MFKLVQVLKSAVSNVVETFTSHSFYPLGVMYAGIYASLSYNVPPKTP